MVRPRTPMHSNGTIHLQEIAPGKWRARTRYRFDNGTLRQIERFGATKAKARTALQEALVAPVLVRVLDVGRDTNLSELADRFLRDKANRAPRTVDTYRQTVEHHIKPKIGSVTVSEATTERLGRFISEVEINHGPGAAKACRAVLSGMMGVASRSDAIRHNPVREIANIERVRKGAKAVPVSQLALLLERVRADERLRELDQVDVIEFLAATGCRLGEALGLSWEAVNFETQQITFRNNVVRAHGQGILLQSHLKTKAGTRTISVPATLMAMLVHRKANFSIRNDHNLVFPTIRGNIRDPRNTSRDWRNARSRLGFPDVTTHSFRKTVATALDLAGLSARSIAEYLGQANPSITQDVYMSKTAGGTKAAEALEEVLGAESKVRG